MFTKAHLVRHYHNAKNFLGKAYHTGKSILGHVDHGIRTAKEIYSVVDTTIAEYCVKYATNVVIHGHTHNPGKYAIDVNIATLNLNAKIPNQILRFEIPDWSDHKIGGYVLLDGDDITLQTP